MTVDYAPATTMPTALATFIESERRRADVAGTAVVAFDRGGVWQADDHDRRQRIQLYFRRQKASELAWGDSDYHRELVASELAI